MTVQELIDELEQHTDKSVPVVLFDGTRVVGTKCTTNETHDGLKEVNVVQLVTKTWPYILS